jgi:hypothetical protein
VLPPGTMDELYCPSGYCLRSNPDFPPYILGVMNQECYNSNTGSRIGVTPWGSNQGNATRQRLRDDGYTTAYCYDYTSAVSALPPGYQDELFCPPNFCMEHRTDLPSGFVGPPTAYHFCYDASNDTKIPVVAWGSSEGLTQRQHLKSLGFTSRFCTNPQTYGMVPPGYEDELYCPSGYCLRNVTKPPGFVGPPRAYHECHNQLNGSSVAVTPWGRKKGTAAKASLLEHDYSSKWCMQPSTFGVLPPGYEDEMWCPQQSCIRKKNKPAGFVGPLSSSHECYNPFTGKILPITAWGSKQGAVKRQKSDQQRIHSRILHEFIGFPSFASWIRR